MGEVIDISVNWSSLDGSPDLDALNTRVANILGQKIPRQRVMMITGRQACANLLVVPCRTTTALAVMVLRQAAGLPIAPGQVDTETFRTADGIVRAARAESALRRLRTAQSANVDTADGAMSG